MIPVDAAIGIRIVCGFKMRIKPTDRANLESAWGLATLPMANTQYAQAVLQFLDDADGGVCPRALKMFELAIEICAMRGDLGMLLRAWIADAFEERTERAKTQPIALDWRAA